MLRRCRGVEAVCRGRVEACRGVSRRVEAINTVSRSGEGDGASKLLIREKPP